MASIVCTNCGQTFVSKKSFVAHLVTKMCFRSVPEAGGRRISLRRKEDDGAGQEPRYPTREIVPVQGCAGCRRYSRPGLQMYMLAHLATHLANLTWRRGAFACEDCDFSAEKSKNLAKHIVKKHSNKLEEKETVTRSVDTENKNIQEEEDSACCYCDMAFQDSSVLTQHIEEVHSA